MNNSEIVKNVNRSMGHQIDETGMASPVQTLMDLGVLSKQDYENWRFGKVDYLERVCKINLSKLSFIMKQIRQFGKNAKLKESWTFYKRWGLKDKTKKIQLRFSKTNSEFIERAYATHYICPHKLKSAPQQQAGETD